VFTLLFGVRLRWACKKGIPGNKVLEFQEKQQIRLPAYATHLLSIQE